MQMTEQDDDVTCIYLGMNGKISQQNATVVIEMNQTYELSFLRRVLVCSHAHAVVFRTWERVSRTSVSIFRSLEPGSIGMRVIVIGAGKIRRRPG